MASSKAIKPDRIITHDSNGYQVYFDPSHDPNGETIDEAAYRLWDENTPGGTHVRDLTGDSIPAPATGSKTDFFGRTKKVEFHTDPNWKNGLRVGARSSQPYTGGQVGGGRVDWRVALLAAVVFLVILFLICRASGGIQ